HAEPVAVAVQATPEPLGASAPTAQLRSIDLRAEVLGIAHLCVVLRVLLGGGGEKRSPDLAFESDGRPCVRLGAARDEGIAGAAVAVRARLTGDAASTSAESVARRPSHPVVTDKVGGIRHTGLNQVLSSGIRKRRRRAARARS